MSCCFRTCSPQSRQRTVFPSKVCKCAVSLDNLPSAISFSRTSNILINTVYTVYIIYTSHSPYNVGNASLIVSAWLCSLHALREQQNKHFLSVEFFRGNTDSVWRIIHSSFLKKLVSLKNVGSFQVSSYKTLQNFGAFVCSELRFTN